MLFNSIHFLFFLPVVIALYYLIPFRFRWMLIFFSSCYFYMALVPKYILILFAIIIIDYISALLIERQQGRTRKLLLVLSICSNVLLLAFFKYFNFLNENLIFLLDFFDKQNPVGNLSIILPIGLSFHTFQSMAYTIEVYRGNQKAERHLGYFANYVLFFPQMVAGPDVIYFAESSNWSSHKDDTLKKSISELTAEYYPSLAVRAVQKGAIHTGIYLPLIKQIDEEARVKTVIVTMNLRSFDATWIHSKLETALQRSKILYTNAPLIGRSLISLNCYDNKTESQREADMKAQWERYDLKFPYGFKYKNVMEWDKGMANGGYVNADGSCDMPRIELACHYIKTYAFQIDANTNPRIKDFDAIVNVCKEKEPEPGV